MQVKSRVHNHVLYVLLCGELDEHSATYTRITLDEIFDKPNFDKIIFDLSELDFMDSTGIGVLIGRYKKMKDKDIPILLPIHLLTLKKFLKSLGFMTLCQKLFKGVLFYEIFKFYGSHF